MKTLEQILKATEKASKNGMFGLDACKESIKSQIEMDKKYFNKETSLYTFIKRQNWKNGEWRWTRRLNS